MDRWIAQRKFYNNLAPRLDREIERALQQQPPPEQPRTIEHGTFGEDGWFIRKHHPMHDDD